MQFLVRFLAGPRHYRPSINGDAPRLDASPTLFLDRPAYAFPLTLYHRLLCDGISKWKCAMDRVGRLSSISNGFPNIVCYLFYYYRHELVRAASIMQNVRQTCLFHNAVSG